MFGISPAEFAVIAVILLIAVGPKQLPDVLRTLGRIYKKLNLFIRNASQLIDDTLYDSDRLAEKAEKYLTAEPIKKGESETAGSPERKDSCPDKKAPGPEGKMPEQENAFGSGEEMPEQEKAFGSGEEMSGQKKTFGPGEEIPEQEQENFENKAVFVRDSAETEIKEKADD